LIISFIKSLYLWTESLSKRVTLFKHFVATHVSVIVIIAFPVFLAAHEYNFPSEPQWPAIEPIGSNLLELNAYEHLFEHAHLIIKGLYRQPAKNNNKDWRKTFTPYLTSEWSQLCLVQIETPTKIGYSFNSGIGYRIKHYQRYSLFHHHHVTMIQPSFLMPFTFQIDSFLKECPKKTIFNLEFQVDRHYISRNITLLHKIVQHINHFGDINILLYGDHTQFMTFDDPFYESKPTFNIGFRFHADLF